MPSGAPRPPSAPAFLPRPGAPLKSTWSCQCLLVSLPPTITCTPWGQGDSVPSCVTKPAIFHPLTKYFPALSHLSNANSPCKAGLPPPGNLLPPRMSSTSVFTTLHSPMGRTPTTCILVVIPGYLLIRCGGPWKPHLLSLTIPLYLAQGLVINKYTEHVDWIKTKMKHGNAQVISLN